MGKSKDTLARLIEQRLSPGADMVAIDKKIWAMFGETWAILCSDMSGFTRRTDEFGIIHFLTLIHEMQKLLIPVTIQNNGILIKTEADNLFVIFREPHQALNCALEMIDATIRYNENKSADYQIAICVGIGFGKVIKLGDEDCFGNEVNRAFKLGEDIAKAHEILLTCDTYEAVKNLFPNLAFEEKQSSSIGLINNYFKVTRST